jgi:hypothetical protein
MSKKNLGLWLSTWKKELAEHKILIIISLFLLLIANIMSYYASAHVDKIQTVAVPDLILDHIPRVNVSPVFVYGFLLVIAVIIVYTLFFRPRRLHQVAFLFSLLVFARSFSILLTHLGLPAGAVLVTNAPPLFQSFYFNNDLFFSGHTAMPFMAFLLFRKEKIGWFFLAMTVVLGASALLMHVHYSIDVFGAVFVTYGVYKLGEWFCTKVCPV